MTVEYRKAGFVPAQRRVRTGWAEFVWLPDVKLIEPQVFGVLRYLIENRDRVVSKDELVNAVWAGRIVSDATISSRISAARTAVRSRAARPSRRWSTIRRRR